jgi:hypothetical protein
MRPISSWIMICVFLTGCATKPQAPATKPGQRAKVYYQGIGPEHDVKRFGKFLDIALDDYGLVQATSAAEADYVVKVELKTEESTRSLYSPVLWITFKSNKGEEYIDKACNTISTAEDIFTKPAEDWGAAVKFPAGWEKANEKLAVYMDEPLLKDSAPLVNAVKKALLSESYRIVQSRAEADVELKSVSLQKLIVPEKVIVYSQNYDVSGKNSGSFSSGKGGLPIYIGLEDSVNIKNVPCGPSFASFGSVDKSAPYWSDARQIAKDISERETKEVKHSN